MPLCDFPNTLRVGFAQTHLRWIKWSSWHLQYIVSSWTQWAFSSEQSKRRDCADTFPKTQPAMIHWLLSQVVWKPRKLVGSFYCFLLFYWACQNDQYLHMLMFLGCVSVFVRSFVYCLIHLQESFGGQLMLLEVVTCAKQIMFFSLFLSVHWITTA